MKIEDTEIVDYIEKYGISSFLSLVKRMQDMASMGQWGHLDIRGCWHVAKQVGGATR